jgi:hypothetical protein
MKRQMKTIVLLSALLGLGSVQAATITYETREINAGVNSADYKASWYAQTSAITSANITDFNLIWGGNNTFSHLIVDFSSDASQLLFQLGVDAGYGGALYLNRSLIAKNPNDLWWNYSWTNNGQLLFSYTNAISAGNYILESFWAEDCCNGANSGRLSLDGGTSWQALSTTNLNALAPVPVPAAVWLFGSGIAGLMGFSRKKMLVAPIARHNI